MKVNFKVKMNVTIEFFVEIYFSNDVHFFEKYFTWENIQPSREYLDTLYTWIRVFSIPICFSGTVLIFHYQQI